MKSLSFAVSFAAMFALVSCASNVPPPEDEKAETQAAEPDPAKVPEEAVSGSEPAEQAEKTGGCASRIGSGVSFVLPAIGAGAVLSSRKKKHGFPGSAAFHG